MDIGGLTDMLVESSQQYPQAKCNPWWEGNHEEAIYRYNIFSRETLRDVRDCVAGCGKEELFSPVGCKGLTLFHLLVWHNFYDTVEELLRSGKVSGEEVDVRDSMGNGLTPFLLACACGNAAMVRLLLDYGADGTACDSRGMNGYHFLAYPRIEELSFASSSLERSGMQRREIACMLPCDINKKDRDGMTPLVRLLAMEYSSDITWSLADIYVEKGAAIDYVDEEGNTLLMMAMKHGHKTAALRLIERCPELLDRADGNGRTPVEHAVYFENMGMYIALTDHGAALPGGEKMELFPLSQIAGNAFAKVGQNDKDGLGLALYLTKKLVQQADPDDDDEIGEVTDVLHNALISDNDATVLDIFQDAGYDFTMLLHYHGSRICLRDECLHPAYGIGAVRKLVELGVDMDKAVVRGQTPASIIASQDCRSGSWEDPWFEEAARLLSRESMEQLDDRGEAAVHLAARRGHLDMLRVMAEKGVDMNLAEDVPARAGMTPLHEACAAGYGDVVKLLMAAGGDDTAKDLEGETPAHFALQERRFGKGPDTEQRACVLRALEHLDIPRNDGQTPLMLLKDGGELLSILLDRGVDVNHRDNQGRTAMMLHPHKDMIKELLKAGADMNLADNEGNTVLHYALREYSEGTARYLIKKGIDYSRANNDGETPADIAVENGFETVLELMV